MQIPNLTWQDVLNSFLSGFYLHSGKLTNRCAPKNESARPFSLQITTTSRTSLCKCLCFCLRLSPRNVNVSTCVCFAASSSFLLLQSYVTISFSKTHTHTRTKRQDKDISKANEDLTLSSSRVWRPRHSSNASSSGKDNGRQGERKHASVRVKPG